MDKNLTSGGVLRSLLQFAIPLLVANILQQLYSIIDSIIVGQYVGDDALAAVTASYPLFYFLISLVIGVGGGLSILVSHYYGASRHKEVQQIASTYFIFLLGIGLLISLLGVFFAEELFVLLGTPPSVIPEAIAYFQIYISGTFFYITFNGFISILRGVGDSVTPLWLTLLSILLNFVLDLLFVAYFDFGVSGAAYATLISHAFAMVLSATYLNRKHPILSFRIREFTFHKDLFWEGLKIGIPSGIRQSSISLGLIALLTVVNRFGAETLTAYGIVGRIESILGQPMVILGGALATFVGQNMGAKKMSRINKALQLSLLMTSCFCLLSFFIIYLFDDFFIGLFTKDLQVKNIASTYLLITFAFYVFIAIANVLHGFLRGVGDTLFSMLVTILSLWILRFPIAALWSSEIGETGIWYAIVVSWAIELVASVIYYKSGQWRKRSVRLKAQ